MSTKKMVEWVVLALQETGCTMERQLDKLLSFSVDFDNILLGEAKLYLCHKIDLLTELLGLQGALSLSWSADTCYPLEKNHWPGRHPSFGQCAVTALVVQDIFGGEIINCKKRHHYWNRLPDGREVDFTRSQFPDGTTFTDDGEKSRDEILKGPAAEKADTKARYEMLKENVEKILGKK